MSLDVLQPKNLDDYLAILNKYSIRCEKGGHFISEKKEGEDIPVRIISRGNAYWKIRNCLHHDNISMLKTLLKKYVEQEFKLGEYLFKDEVFIKEDEVRSYAYGQEIDKVEWKDEEAFLDDMKRFKILNHRIFEGDCRIEYLKKPKWFFETESYKKIRLDNGFVEFVNADYKDTLREQQQKIYKYLINKHLKSYDIELDAEDFIPDKFRHLLHPEESISSNGTTNLINLADFNGNAITVADVEANTGIRYAADYESHFSQPSVVTKEELEDILNERFGELADKEAEEPEGEDYGDSFDSAFPPQ